MKIWAHRGCSQMYPENTLLAFEKAMEIEGLEGIELDIQLTKDGEMVVIHDERIDRNTEGIGFVREYMLSELKRFHIYAGADPGQRIPVIDEVFDLLAPRMKPDAAGRNGTEHAGRGKGLRLNIELKNSIYPYPGMEEKIVELVHSRGLQGSIVYSSFSALSMEKIKELDPEAEIGILDGRVSDCLYKAAGLGGNGTQEVAALHPFWQGMDLPAKRLEGRTVRAWFGGHLYPEKPTGGRLDLGMLERQGITDVFLNEPEVYLRDDKKESV